jgi:hypothetical protein
MAGLSRPSRLVVRGANARASRASILPGEKRKSERLAGAGRSHAHASLATPLETIPRTIPAVFAAVAVAVRVWRNGLIYLMDLKRCEAISTRGKSACFWLGPISGSHQGPQPERLHLEAEYMAAPVSFRERSDSFPLRRGRRPYMALPGHKPLGPYVRSRRKQTYRSLILLGLVFLFLD